MTVPTASDRTRAEERAEILRIAKGRKIAFDDYVAAVGRVSHAWNHLHEQFAELFAIVSAADQQVALE
jgi:hypothetical protein